MVALGALGALGALDSNHKPLDYESSALMDTARGREWTMAIARGMVGGYSSWQW